MTVMLLFYMDATYIPLKRKTVAKEAIHIAVGVRPDGSKEDIPAMRLHRLKCITIWGGNFIGPSEERGLKNVLLFITDGLKGMVEAIESVLSRSSFSTLLCTRFP